MSRLLALTALALGAASAAAQPASTLDLAAVSPQDQVARWVYGATGEGDLGLPVAGGSDCDGDGFRDYAVAFFRSDPLGRRSAGEVDLVFGDGKIDGFIDTSAADPSLLRILGAGDQETAGNEIWMDDVTGDGLGDLLICRQNHTPDASRIGAGALTILAGGPELRDHAARLRSVDLASPPDELTLVTFLGARELDRLGIWVRTGDVTGDGIADIVVGADQEDLAGEDNRGAVYVVRGGGHLAAAGVIDLRDFGATALAGHVARITPPPGSTRFHFGATCQIADLDGNGRGEVLAAAALNRGGASVAAAGAPPGAAEAVGGSPRGTLFIAWDDNFPAGIWPAGFSFDVARLPGARTVLAGGEGNRSFGEEIIGGLDYDGDGDGDLFVGDLAGDGSGQNRPVSGVGHVFYRAAGLKGMDLELGSLPADFRLTTILGPAPGAIGGDTAAQGDFDGDGVDDLAFASPHASPRNRLSAGAVHVLHGRSGGWPARIDTAPGGFPSPSAVRITEIQGASGAAGSDRGDTLAYSAAAADLDDDGRTDLIANEMLGNGIAPETTDVGNLILVSGAAMSGSCRSGPETLCLNGRRFAVEVEWRDFKGERGRGRVVTEARDSGLFWFFSPDNWEMLVKVLDGCAINDRVWVFAAATTNVEYTLRVRDTKNGMERSYFNPLGNSAAAITDTGALPSCP